VTKALPSKKGKKNGYCDSLESIARMSVSHSIQPACQRPSHLNESKTRQDSERASISQLIK
jgi:hypothetical protein